MVVQKWLYDRLHGSRRIIDDDMRTFIQGPGRPVYADGCADTVGITVLMAHDHNIVLALDHLSESVSLDSCPHAF